MTATESSPSLALPDLPVVNDVTRHLTFHRSFLPVWERNADAPGPTCGDRSHTWGEHRERVIRLVDALGSELGLGRTSRYAVLALNSIEYLELYHAAYLGGGIINPLNIRLAAKEIAFILDDSGTEVVFVDAIFAPLVEAIRDEVSSVRAVVLVGPEPEGEVRIDHRYDDLIEAGRPVVPPETEETDPACLMYTGGTTGLPKGVIHTQRSHSLAIAVFDRAGYGVDRESTYLIAAPMFHAATQPGVTAAPVSACRLLIIPMFSPAAFLDAVEHGGGSMTLIVPTMIRMVIDDPSCSADRLRNMKILTYGGSPMPLGVLERVLELLPDGEVVQGYGMTEGLPLTLLPDADHRAG